MRRNAEFFGEVELDLVYMARRLADALKLEDLLTREGIDYLVEPGPYIGGLLMRRELTGAFFYVAPSDVSAAHNLLIRNRYKPYQSN